MTLPAQLRAIADRIEAADQERIEAITDAIGLLALRTVDSGGTEAAVQVAAGADSGEAGSVEDPVSPSAIEQVAPAASPGRESAAARPPATDPPASPGTDSPRRGAARTRVPAPAAGNPASAFDPLGPKPSAIVKPLCPECQKPCASPQGVAVHRARMHGIEGATRVTSREERAAWKAGKRKKPALVTEGDPTEPNGHDFKAEPVLRHGVEWFPCPQCPVKHTSKAHLDQHIARAHRESAGEAKRPTIAERVAARDASRAADQAKRARRYGRV